MWRRAPDRLDGLNDLNRRWFLRGLAATPLVAVPIPAAASPGDDVEITLRQGGREVATVSPIVADRTIEDFYRYDRIDNASANTPMNLRESGVTKLFFYRRTGADTPLSLVVIHDAPRDGGGGDVRFDFQPNALPSGGGWAVEDDPGETFTRTVADWGWAPCCTDGGAYRGGFDDGVQVTIDPSFNSGIGRWDLLDGDGSVVAELSRTAPVTLSVGSAEAGPDLDALVDEKLALASRIDANALGLMDDRDAVEPVLTRLVEAAKSDGEPSLSEAVEAVQRLLAGERITDAVLAGAGPGTSPHLDTDTNISGLTAKFAINPMLEIIFTGISLVKAARIIPGLRGMATDAARWLGRFVADVAGRFNETLERIIRARAKEAGFAIFEGAESVAKEEGRSLTEEEFRTVRDTDGAPFLEDSSTVIFADTLFDEDYDLDDVETVPLDDSVADLVAAMDTEPAGLDLDGDTDDALTAAEATLDDINANYVTLDSQLRDNLLTLFLSHAGLFAGAMTALGVVAGVLGATVVGYPVAGLAFLGAALIGAGAGTFSMILWGTGANGILAQRFEHMLAIREIIDPEVG